MLETVSQFFAKLSDTCQAAIIASIVTLVGVLVASIVALLGVWLTHRGNERRFRKQLDYDRQQKRIERRAEIIAELYSKLVELRKAASDFVHWYGIVNEKTKKQYLEQLWRAADAFGAHFGRHRIYFDQSICTSIDTFREALSKASSILATFVHDAESIEVSDDQVFEEWERAVVMFDREVPTITNSLETSFRRLLDIERQHNQG